MKTVTIPIAVIGLGSIGGAVVRSLLAEPVPGLRLVGVMDIRPPEPALADTLREAAIPVVTTLDELLALAPTHVLEAAGVEAVAAYVLPLLRAGVCPIVMSSGAFTDEKLLAEALALHTVGGPRIMLPSGAVAGVDVVRAAAAGTLRKVHLRTVKPAGALAGTPGSGAVAGEPTILFSGTAREAARLYPRNVNVAMTLALAGLGPDKTTVELVADPAATENSHEVTVEGDFGTARITLVNRPSPSNPRTSQLAVDSALAVLKSLVAPLFAGA